MGRFFRLYLPLVLLLILASGYSVYWYAIAERVQNGLDDWATAQRAKGYEVRWTAATVGGFPFSLQVRATSRDRPRACASRRRCSWPVHCPGNCGAGMSRRTKP